MQPTDGSAVTQIVGLKDGQTYSRSIYIPYEISDPEVIKKARRQLVSYMTPVVARAREHKDRNYRIHTIAALTTKYDVIVTGVIVIEPEEEDTEV